MITECPAKKSMRSGTEAPPTTKEAIVVVAKLRAGEK